MSQEIENYLKENLRRLEARRRDRDCHLRFLEELFDLFDPNYVSIYTNPRRESSGIRGDKRIYDSKGIQGVTLFSNALHSTLYTPFQPFFQFSYDDDQTLQSSDLIQEAFSFIDQDLQKVFSYQSNFHSTKSELLNDYVIAGEETTFVDGYPMGHDNFGMPIFRGIPFDQLYYQEGFDTEIDTYWRQFTLKAYELTLFPEFQEAIERDPELKSKVTREDDSKIELIHYTAPKKDETTFLRSHRFVSVYYIKDKLIPLNLKGGLFNGMEEQAVMTNRFRVKSGEINARSDTMGVLGDAKSLQTLAMLRLKLVAKAVDPPYSYAVNSIIDKINLTAGGGTPVKRPGAIEFHDQGGRLDAAFAEGNYLSDNVLKGFHRDDFRFPENLPQMTASEAQIRSTLMQGQLSPIISRSTPYIKRIVERVFWMRNRAGFYIDYIDVLRNLNENKLKIDIISPLAKAQRANDIIQLQSFMRFIDERSQLDPSLSKLLDNGKAIRWMASNINTAFAQFIRSQDQIDEETAQEQALSAIPQAADAVESISKAQLNNAKALSL